MEKKKLDAEAAKAKQHPLYYHLLLARQEAAEGEVPGVAVIDNTGSAQNAPRLYGQKPMAVFKDRSEATLNARYHDPYEDDEFPVAQNASEVPMALGDRDSHWAGKITVDVAGEKVTVHGFIYGDPYDSCYSVYVVAAKSQAVLDSFFADCVYRERERIASLSSRYIFVSDAVGVQRPTMSWDDVVLASDQRETIERNIEAFFSAKDSYHKHKLAYRRGILMVGPPGNGKSSVIKILSSQYRNISFFMYGFSAEGNDPSRLNRLFARAAECSPSIVILEDIDRVAKEHVMRAILNILDGITSSDGVFVLATSNNAGEIDPALIERPSRFDLVMRFNNPKEEQRKAYLAHKFKGILDGPQLEQMTGDTADFSMAMLQELFTGAVLEAVLAKRDPCWDDVRVSHKRLSDSLSTARKETGSKPASGVGFSKR